MLYIQCCLKKNNDLPTDCLSYLSEGQSEQGFGHIKDICDLDISSVTT